MARGELREGAKTGKKPPAPAPEQHELEDPKRQVEILNPEVLRYVLLIDQDVIEEKLVNSRKVRTTITETVKRAIIVPTELTLGDIVTRRIKDDIFAFVAQATLEVQTRITATAKTITTRDVATALLAGQVAAQLRAIVSRLARFEDDPESNPTVTQIEDGMDVADLNAIGIMYFARTIEEQERQKKARAAALA